MIVKNQLLNRYLRNILALVLLIIYGIFVLYGSRPSPGIKAVLAVILFYSFLFFWVVLHNLLLLEKLLLKRRFLFYFISLIPFAALWVFVSKLIMPIAGYNYSIPLEIFSFSINTFLGLFFYLGSKYLLEQKKYYQLNILKRDFELKQLKSQLNPHFLFNALNNIYSYTLHSKEYGNDLILKLSELMRFILDSSEKETIYVCDEVKFIENYIAFEKERLGKRCNIIYSKNIIYENRNIAPLILFPFVENAFKYGADSIQKTSIEILIFDTTDTLKLVVRNSIINKSQPSTKKGLPNARRRLELLYPEKHDLKIEITEELFIVDLTLRYDKNNSTDSRR